MILHNGESLTKTYSAPWLGAGVEVDVLLLPQLVNNAATASTTLAPSSRFFPRNRFINRSPIYP
jgi:hypothetical protein